MVVLMVSYGNSHVQLLLDSICLNVKMEELQS